MNEALMRGICFFTRETEILSSLAAVCGAGDRMEYLGEARGEIVGWNTRRTGIVPEAVFLTWPA